MIDITKEMQEIIEKSLPAATAGAMSDFIIEAEKTEQKLALADEQVNNLGKQINRLQEENILLNERLEAQNDLERRENELEEKIEALSIRERDLQLELAQIKLTAANERNNTVERLVEKVFGHPSVTVSTYRDKPIMVDSGNGIAPYQSGSTAESENTTTTESKG